MEGNESIVIDITSVSGSIASENGTQQRTVTLIDDEAAPAVTLSTSAASISEGGDSSVITVALDQAAEAGNRIEVNWYYEEEDETIFEFGEELKADFTSIIFNDHPVTT